MSIFTDEKNKKEFARIFREKTMSGFLDKDKAIDLIIRDYPHLFYQPTEAELLQSSRTTLNAEIRSRALQTNKFTDSFFTKGKE
jgi:hypothetical protein